MKIKLEEIILSEEAEAAWQGLLSKFTIWLGLTGLGNSSNDIVVAAEVKGDELILYYRWSGQQRKKLEGEMTVPAGHWQWRTSRN